MKGKFKRRVRGQGEQGKKRIWKEAREQEERSKEEELKIRRRRRGIGRR